MSIGTYSSYSGIYVDPNFGRKWKYLWAKTYILQYIDSDTATQCHSNSTYFKSKSFRKSNYTISPVFALLDYFVKYMKLFVEIESIISACFK